MKRNTIIATALITISGLVACTGKASEEAEKYRAGWEILWEDDMDVPGGTGEWSRIAQGDLPMNRYMSNNEALYVYQDDNLVLRGLPNSAENSDASFLTAGIYRHAVAKDQVRRIEVRARAVPAAGTASFISLVPSDGTANIMIDLMERYGEDAFMYQSVTSEYTTTEGMPDNPPSSALVGVDPSQYHTYAVEKYADSLVFYVDNTRTRKYPRILTDIPGQYPFNDIDFNLHIGVRINKDADPEVLPIDLFIDWVRIYGPASVTKE